MVPADAIRWSLVSTRLGCWVSVPILLALGGASLAAQSDQYEGKSIESIRFDPEKQPLTRDQLLAMIPLRSGQALKIPDVRATIERLFKTGEYSDIVVHATSGTSGLIVTVATTPNFFVGHISVTGVPDPPNEGQLVLATKLELGKLFSDEDLTNADARIEDVVRRNGFYHSSLQSEKNLQTPYQQVNLDFKVEPGKRAKFDGLKTTGDPDRSLESLVKSTGWKRFLGLFGWHSLTEARVRSGLDNMRDYYPKHNHLLAKIRLVSLDYHDSTNTVTPEVSIDPGARVEVQLKGAKMSSGKLRSILPIYEERSVDRDLLEEGSRDLVSYYQSKGFFDATVSYSTSTPPSGDEYINYTVDQGVRHKVVKLEITGNHYFDTESIRERISVIPASFIRYRYGRYSRVALDRDLEGIRDLYRANGFRDVEVSSKEIDDYSGKSGRIAILVSITEGPQWFVSKLDITGVPSDDLSAILILLHSTAGQPYSDLDIARDREFILDYYFNQGYPSATFEFTSTPAGQPNYEDLTYVVMPGTREFVRNIVIGGLKRTHEDVVRSRIDLEPGDPLSQNKITGSQRRLYELGIFARVDTALQNPDGEEPDKNVLYSIDEAHRYVTNYGVGAEIGAIGGGSTSLESPAGVTGFSPRVLFGITRLNFLGTGHTIGLQTLVSTLEQRAQLTYFSPQFLGNEKLNLQFQGLFDISHDIRTFSARREEGSVQLGQKLSRAFTVQYRYTYRKVNVLGTPLITPELIPLLSQPVRVGFVSTTIIQDQRDDPVDTHRGMYNSLDMELASSALGSQTGFGRILAKNATYYQLTKSLVLARSTTFGMIERYAGLPEIPLAERFFAGGAFSNRAFPDFQAGPRDLETGFPIGGNALFVNTVELRFPLIGDDIGGVLFNDLGNVYSDVNKISLRFRQQNLQDFDYAVQGFGFGIRYRTPVGPVRVDFSLSPDSPRFFGFQGTENQLLFGSGTAVVQRINVFQFHFSLGQTF